MTAYVAFRAVQAGEATLASPIKVTRHAAGEPPSKMGFKPGSVMRLDNALEMMLVKSANDIAMAVAENIGGSQEAFAARMNAEAARLGMTGTHFVNPNGLFSPEQYTTARDLAVLVTALRRDYPQYMPWFSIQGIAVGKRHLPNYNLLIGRYPGADGMKTGFVCESGFNQIGSATRGGRTLVAVVLGEQSAVSRAEVAANLLDAGFAAPSTGTTTLATLKPYGDTETPTNLRETLCHKKTKEELSEAAEAPKQDKPKSPYQIKLVHPVEVALGLGGATGPVPKALADAGGNDFADVPVPAWRPDIPPPDGFGAVASGASGAGGQQGDGPAKPAN
jgi:D-alanyl-D-alanine carboxypeptidase